jgi:hypothetical protein
MALAREYECWTPISHRPLRLGNEDARRSTVQLDTDNCGLARSLEPSRLFLLSHRPPKLTVDPPPEVEPRRDQY